MVRKYSLTKRWIHAWVQGFLTTKMCLLIGKKSLLFPGYQCSCSLPVLCHAAEAVVMAISCAVMDSVCDNGCNTLSVLFTLVLTWLLSVSHLSTQFSAATFDTDALTHTQTHAHSDMWIIGRLPDWQRGVVPVMKHLKQAWKHACILSAWIHSQPLVPAQTPHQQVSMAQGDEEEAQFNNAKATSVSQMESLLPWGWRGVGLKQHQAPAGPHDCAVIAA